ncbi:hypothetical protein FJY68_10350 [candidate division WOR-3 bacterium]|uniref:Uncharacterized protein n=1 Tax=candidate division WOR-3 bacterium TaxID=2052148 RepID=A0A937XIC0_UNCW3|nr:hypothetical protein [candidate division WOR-3 bacterium]
MKKIISLILLVAVFGVAFADVPPARRVVPRPVNQPQESISQPGILGPWFRVMLRFVSPSYQLLIPEYKAPSELIPVPPVCGVACFRLQVQGIGK